MEEKIMSTKVNSMKEKMLVLGEWFAKKENVIWLFKRTIQIMFDYAFGLSVLIAGILALVDALPFDIYIDYVWVVRFSAVAGVGAVVKGISEFFTDNKSKLFVGISLIIIGVALTFLSMYALITYY